MGHKCGPALFLAVAIQFLATLLLAGAAGANDLYVSGLVLYAKLPAGSTEANKHGTYPQISEYDLHSGLAPDKIDAVVVANAMPSRELDLTLEISPIAGLTNWAQTEGITDIQLLQNSKIRLSTVLQLHKRVRAQGRTEVKFSDIPLLKIIKAYADRGFWVSEIQFRATIEPVSGETCLSNNLMEFVLTVKPQD